MSQRVPLASQNVNVSQPNSANKILRWQKYLRSCTVYIDQTYLETGPESYKTKNLKLVFKKAGAKIASFFSEDVDIIVSKRPFEVDTQYPKSDMFSKVDGVTTRVWNYTKSVSILRQVGVTFNLAPGTREVSSLQGLLAGEKFKASKFHFFAYKFLYVYDLEKKYRPIVAKEWQDRNSWPCWQHCTNGKSLFIGSSGTGGDLRRSRMKLKFQKTLHQRKQLRRHYGNEKEGPLSDDGAEESEVVESELEDSSVLVNESGAGTLPTNGPSTLVPQGSTVRIPGSLKRRLVVEEEQRKKIAVVTELVPEKPRMPPPSPMMGGQKLRCENCNSYFYDIEKHLKTQSHREYASNDANFAKIDNFIRVLKEDG